MQRTLHQFGTLEIARELPSDEVENEKPQDRLDDRPGSSQFTTHAAIVGSRLAFVRAAPPLPVAPPSDSLGAMNPEDVLQGDCR